MFMINIIVENDKSYLNLYVYKPCKREILEEFINYINSIN